MLADIKVEKLILSHFSSRYSKEEIDTCIKQQIKKYKIKIPVYRILPGVIYDDVLNAEVLN